MAAILFAGGGFLMDYNVRGAHSLGDVWRHVRGR
jgi:hypothetical protein